MHLTNMNKEDVKTFFSTCNLEHIIFQTYAMIKKINSDLLIYHQSDIYQE